MNRYKAIISDVDGTLTQIKIDSLPSPRVIATIKKLKPLNVAFSLATGRPFHLIKSLVDDLALTSPMITDNGAVIISSDGKILWEAVLPSLEAEEISKTGMKYGLTRISTNETTLENAESIPTGYKARKISVHDILPGKADQLILEVGQKYKNIAISRAASYKSDSLLDVYFSHTNATKQHAVMEYAKLMNLKIDEIIGIGDGFNDIPLLMSCGLKVAMGNAVLDLKELADYIAPSVDDDGLASMIEKFVLN